MALTYITTVQELQGLAADKIAASATSAIGSIFFEEDTGLWYKLTAARTWEPIALLSSGDTTIGRVKITDGTDVALVDANGNLSGTRTIKTITGSISATTDLIALVAAKRIKVFCYGLFTTSTTAIVAKFQSNALTDKWTIPLQAPAANSYFGANLAVSPPDFLFATTAGEKLTLNLSTANPVIYSLSYWDDDAT